jgi:ZIP family zinc transporter
MLVLILAATGTALATGVGAIPVSMLGDRARALQPFLIGIAVGVMAVASVAGLLLPGLRDGETVEVLAGFAGGAAFLEAGSLWLGRRDAVRGVELSTARRTTFLVFGALFVHSLPEGFAIGTAYASRTADLGLFVIVAIAVQNVPEGTSVAIPMAAEGTGAARQFWAAVATSAPQPVGAVVAYALVEEVRALLPVSFGFAAGAMLALVVAELLPSALRRDPRTALIGAVAGAAAMSGLSLALGV